MRTHPPPGEDPAHLAELLKLARTCGRLLAENAMEDGDPPEVVRTRLLENLRKVVAESWPHRQSGGELRHERFVSEYQRGFDEVLGPP